MPNSLVDSLERRAGCPSHQHRDEDEASGTRLTCRFGSADVIADTPAAMLTATVSV